MSWTDKKSIETIKKIRDLFKVKTFVETGTCKGINVMIHKDNFDAILSCEHNEEYYNIAKKKCEKYKNILIYNLNSKDLLSTIKYSSYKGYIILYLDAHFYNPLMKNKPNEDRFVVLQELKELKNMTNVIIIIHDFKNNLGNINYDGIDLDFNLLEPYLKKVNPKFYYYTNTLKGCDIMTMEEAKKTRDKEIIENIKYVWSKPEKTYRGILYCLPKKLPDKLMKEMGLTKWGKIK